IVAGRILRLPFDPCRTHRPQKPQRVGNEAGGLTIGLRPWMPVQHQRSADSCPCGAPKFEPGATPAAEKILHLVDHRLASVTPVDAQGRPALALWSGEGDLAHAAASH